MSKPMIFSYPAMRATAYAPTTPPAGPDKTVRTGSFAAACAETIPPEDCITCNRPPANSSSSDCCRPPM